MNAFQLEEQLAETEAALENSSPNTRDAILQDALEQQLQQQEQQENTLPPTHHHHTLPIIHSPLIIPSHVDQPTLLQTQNESDLTIDVNHEFTLKSPILTKLSFDNTHLNQNDNNNQNNNNNQNDNQNDGDIKLYLKGYIDNYNGIVLTINKPIANFPIVFSNSIQKWKDDQRRGCWINLNIKCIDYLTILIKEFQFELHHTDKDYIMLTKWLPNIDIDPNKIPLYCQHYVGVGGICIDFEFNKILLITEKYQRKPKGGESLDYWKVPGGSVDNALESLDDAAVREVFEETGIRSKFVGIFGMRHLKNFRFGKADFYFLCLLKANKASKNQIIQMDHHEIEKCQWFDLEEYFKMNHLNNIQMVIRDILIQYFSIKNNKERKKLLLNMFDVSISKKVPATMYTTCDLIGNDYTVDSKIGNNIVVDTIIGNKLNDKNGMNEKYSNINLNVE